MPDFTLAIDIGNTNTRIGLVDAHAMRCDARETIPTARAVDELGPIAARLHARAPEAPVIAGTTVRRLRSALDDALAYAGVAPVSWLACHPQLPVTIGYRDPRDLGHDRLANLLFAHAAYPGRDVIIINSGTAITVDCLAHGAEFIGGAILPGITLQLASLHEGTAELPEVNTSANLDGKPGASTEECMITGVYEGVAGALERLVGNFRRQMSDDCLVLATGGAWPQHGVAFGFECRYIRDLTLIGIALFERPKI